MEAVGAASAIVGLAIPVFQCAKALRDRVKLVRYHIHPLCTLRELLIVFSSCSQVASEKVELLEALTEYEKDISPPRVTLQPQQETNGSAQSRHRPKGAQKVCVLFLLVRHRI